MSTAFVAAPATNAIGKAVSALRVVRNDWREHHTGRHGTARFPAPSELGRAVIHLASAIFPARLGGFRGGSAREDDFVADQLRQGLAILREQIEGELVYWQAESAAAFDEDQPDTIVRLFAAALGEIRTLLDSDVEAAFVGDPAARSVDEILIAYPGAIALLHHRIAHELFQLGATIVARVISELANARTGIDIHPGATIGPRFFIDHGTGVVIGETAIIGANVRLYQHAALRSAAGAAPLRRAVTR